MKYDRSVSTTKYSPESFILLGVISDSFLQNEPDDDTVAVDTLLTSRKSFRGPKLSINSEGPGTSGCTPARFVYG